MRLNHIAMAAGLAGMLATAMPAAAGNFGLNLGLSTGRHGTRVGVGVGVSRHGTHVGVGVGHGRHGTHVGVGVGVGHVRSAIGVGTAMPMGRFAPVQRVWVAPVYNTVIERVWVPTTETRFRDVPIVNAHGQVIEYRREAYTVATGHWQGVQRQVLVREGYWMATARPAHLKKHHSTVLGHRARAHGGLAVRASYKR